jgi:CheY-like chemotaxis protein
MSMTDKEPVPRHNKAGPPGGHVSIRHELGTPLNAIIGYAEILLESAREEGWEDLVPDLERIRTAGKQLVALLQGTVGSSTAGQTLPSRDTIDATLDFELRTRLNAILGYTDMLLEDAEDQGQQDWIPDLQKIRTAATRFLAILCDAADSAALEAGVPRVEPETLASLSTTLEETNAVCPPEKAKADSKAVQQGHVLVVDDIEGNRAILSHFLEQRGHRVTTAENGRQALEMIRLHPFDLVLLDVLMPEIDGYEVLRRLKSHDTWRDIPVIMISALDEIDSVVRCIKLGAEDYLPKPFDPVLLNARISASLEKKWLRDRETEYLRNVARVTTAAAAVEAGEFEPESLEDVAERTDGLGQLARVFQSMAREVSAREQRLKQQVQQLRIELNAPGQARQVAEITETEYFRRIQGEAQELRDILDGLGD